MLNNFNFRSGTADSRKSGSRSGSGSPVSKHSRHSRSASKSVSNRSRSGSAVSNKSGSANGENRKRKILSDSESNEAQKPVAPKKNKLIDTDSSGDEEMPSQNNAGESKNDLFGDADDISSDEEAAAKSGSEKELTKKGSESDRVSKSRSRSGSRSRRSSRDENDRDEPERSEEREKTPIPETRIDVEIPRITSDLGKEIHFVKLPNFLSVDTRPFDPETYEDEIDEEETLDEEGRQRLKLKVGNTIRWRRSYNSNGEAIMDSNARFVKWSDGSMSLHLGNEIFDVYKQPLQNDHNHLFIRQGTGLQGQAVFRTKLTFRPHSTDSFTHKKMTMSLADRSQKTTGIKIITQVGQDPDADRHANLKKEEEKLRQLIRMRKPIKSKRTKRLPGSSGHHSHDEGSEDEGGISIAAIKNKYKKGGVERGKSIYSTDEEDDGSDGSDFDARRRKKDKTKPVKALKDSDDEEQGSDAGNKTGSDNEGEHSASGKGSATNSDED